MVPSTFQKSQIPLSANLQTLYTYHHTPFKFAYSNLIEPDAVQSSAFTEPRKKKLCKGYVNATNTNICIDVNKTESNRIERDWRAKPL